MVAGLRTGLLSGTRGLGRKRNFFSFFLGGGGKQNSKKHLKEAVLRRTFAANGSIDMNATLITILLQVDSLTQREIQIINIHRVEILKVNMGARPVRSSYVVSFRLIS